MRQGLHFSHSAETVDQLRSKDPSTLTDQEKMILSIAYDLVFTFEHILTLGRGLTPLFILISLSFIFLFPLPVLKEDDQSRHQSRSRREIRSPPRNNRGGMEIRRR